MFPLLLLIASAIPALSVDPEVNLGAAGIIRRWDYPVEAYNVTTPDGYILDIFRIPGRQNQTIDSNETRPVVFFQHGLEADCVQWISNLPNQSGPFIYADLGFDVWLGNFRGTRYGKKHVNMTSADHEFWKFSWDQMAQYDLPTMLNFVLHETGTPSLYYIGHSMGTLTAFAAFSNDQKLGQKIKKFYGLAPLITVGHIKGALRMVANFMNRFQWAINTFGSDQFAAPNWLTKELAIYGCGNKYTEAVCSNVLFWMTGPTSNQLNDTRMPVYMAHTPAGTSTKNVLHFAQMMKSNKFQKFDYGKENKKIYNSVTPPLYDVTKMETPVSLFYGGNDWLADPEDVESMVPLLKNCDSKVLLKDFNHMDFMWGNRSTEEMYLPIARDIVKHFA